MKTNDDNLNFLNILKKDDHLLIIGGTGFFGRSILRLLMLQNLKKKLHFNVTISSRDPEKFLSMYPEFLSLCWLHFIQFDLINSNNFGSKNFFSHIIHAAYDSSKNILNDSSYIHDSIVYGTKKILDILKTNTVKSFLFCSSGAVYNNFSVNHICCESDDIKENITSPSKDTYAYSKLKAEKLCNRYFIEYSCPVKIARCFSFIGEDLLMSRHYAINNFIHNALDNEPIEIYGDGKQIRSYLYQEDLAIWLLRILFFGENNNVYNVGSDKSYSLFELANIIKEVLCKNIIVNINGSESLNPRFCYIPSIKKSRYDLSLDVWTDLQTSITRTIGIH